MPECSSDWVSTKYLMCGGYINWVFDLKLLKNILKALQKWVSISLQSLKIDLFYQNILSENPKLWLITYSILTKASPKTSFSVYQQITHCRKKKKQPTKTSWPCHLCLAVTLMQSISAEFQQIYTLESPVEFCMLVLCKQCLLFNFDIKLLFFSFTEQY